MRASRLGLAAPRTESARGRGRAQPGRSFRRRCRFLLLDAGLPFAKTFVRQPHRRAGSSLAHLSWRAEAQYRPRSAPTRCMRRVGPLPSAGRSGPQAESWSVQDGRACEPAHEWCARAAGAGPVSCRPGASTARKMAEVEILYDEARSSEGDEEPDASKPDCTSPGAPEVASVTNDTETGNSSVLVHSDAARQNIETEHLRQLLQSRERALADSRQLAQTLEAELQEAVSSKAEAQNELVLQHRSQAEHLSAQLAEAHQEQQALSRKHEQELQQAHTHAKRQEEACSALRKEHEDYRRRIQQLEVRFEASQGELARSRAVVEQHDWALQKAVEVLPRAPRSPPAPCC
eukprot:scaffold1941_cov377-Prasinococcus_capsulatus_cf.AAC.8